MPSKIINRFLKTLGDPNLIDKLADQTNLTDLQSLLPAVYRLKTAKLTTKNLVSQYKNNRFVTPSCINPKILREFDTLAFSLLPAGTDVIELSPAAPLGACSVVAPVDQNNVLTTVRNTEVCSDPTNVPALECAVRRQELIKTSSQSSGVKLCASQRVIRSQRFDIPAAFAHFQLLGLSTAGRDSGSFVFELNSLREHIEYWLALLKALKKYGYTHKDIRVTVTDFNPAGKSVLAEQLMMPPALKVRIDFDHQRQQGRGYYSQAGFQIFALSQNGEKFLIADGGDTDWTQKLLHNKKERLLISGFGSERMIFCFSPLDSNEAP